MPILYLAPWVDEGSSDEGTVEWFEQLDRARWAPSLITTQPSRNRALHRIEPYAEEVWDLPDLMPGASFPEFILGFVEDRAVQVLHVMDSRLGLDLLPDIACLARPPVTVVQLHDVGPGVEGYARYAARRYGNLIDAFSVTGKALEERLVELDIPPSRVHPIGGGDGGHDGLYRDLLAARPPRSRWRDDALRGGEPTAGALAPLARPALPRDPAPERSVGIVVPCYRHGIFIGECIDSVKAQTLPAARIVVVDDASDDPETIAAIARLEDDPAIEVLRQPSNLGPSAARNRALAVLDTSYVLPIDADDKLLPDALERMLAQLEAAPEDVGFVYPHAQHFGNRTDYVRLPAYNLWLLMRENYCPAPALFDRRVFEADGVGYPEEIVVGHEDWDLILQLAERGIHGLHASGPTFLYRRQGFSRVNAADYGPHEFQDAIERRHPRLYGNRDGIKTEWAPALSILLLDEPDPWTEADLAGLPEQTCADFELLAQTGLAAGTRALGSGREEPAEWLQRALEEARGRWICVLSRAAIEALRDRGFVERTIYAFGEREERFVLALGLAPELTRHAFSQLDDAERLRAEPVGLAFERRAAAAPPAVDLSGEEPLLAECVLGLQASEVLQWRLVAPDGEATRRTASRTSSRPGSLRLGLDRSLDKSEFATRDLLAHERPRLPELTRRTARREEDEIGWTPPGTEHLCRHVRDDGGHRILANHRRSPPGYALEFDLGALHLTAAPGMLRLVHANHSFELTEDQNDLGEDRHGLGYIEQQQLPQLERLELRRMPAGGEEILVAGPLDPLYEIAEPLAELGWIEPFPLAPRDVLAQTGPWRAIELHRQVDARGWKHRYGEDGGVALGSLYPYPGPGLLALRRRDDGRLASELGQAGRASRDPRRYAHWLTAAPLEEGRSRTGAAGARLLQLAASSGSRRLAEGGGTVLGGLRRAGGPNLFPLFSTTHPVTGDQLVTCVPAAAIARGYLQDGVLGYIHLSNGKPADLS